MNKDKRIVFFGTPEIAAVILEDLIENAYNIVGVVTNEDKQMGRGMKIAYSAVKETALKHNIPVLQPHSMKDVSFQEELRALQADLQIVVAFRMMPKAVYAMPKYGTFNMHTSYLPDYRGAAPINWVIINGEKSTGLSTFLLNDKTDCGDILLQKKIDITDEMTFEDLYNVMENEGKELVRQTIDAVFSGNTPHIRQDESLSVHPAPKIFAQDTYIDFTRTAEEVRNFIRGLSPLPCAKAVFTDSVAQKDYQFKIYKALRTNKKAEYEPGTLFIDKSGEIFVSCADELLQLVDLQLSGKKRMPAKELSKGLRFQGKVCVKK